MIIMDLGLSKGMEPPLATLMIHHTHDDTAKGGARNFGLGGPSCDINILVKTNLYTHMYIN